MTYSGIYQSVTYLKLLFNNKHAMVSLNFSLEWERIPLYELPGAV